MLLTSYHKSSRRIIYHTIGNPLIHTITLSGMVKFKYFVTLEIKIFKFLYTIYLLCVVFKTNDICCFVCIYFAGAFDTEQQKVLMSSQRLV